MTSISSQDSNGKTIFDRFYKYYAWGALLIMLLGVPLVFTPLTRGVFEVNKLIFMRLGILLSLGGILFRACVYAQNQWGIMPKEGSRFSIFGLSWRKSNLDIPTLLWTASLLLSTVLSQNVQLSIYGSYDRWEGLATSLLYVALFWVFAIVPSQIKGKAFLVSTIVGTGVLTSIYGVYQAHIPLQKFLEAVFGIRGINWSFDAASRIFSTINNPVHYCAYIGMLMPLAVALLFYIYRYSQSRSHKVKMLQLIGLAVVIALLYYNLFLSYSRATWVGFLVMMPLFLSLIRKHYNVESLRHFIIDVVLSVLVTGIMLLVFIFKWFRSGPEWAIALSVLAVSFLMLQYFFHYGWARVRTTALHSLVQLVCLYGVIAYPLLYLRQDAQAWLYVIWFVLAISLGALFHLFSKENRDFMSKLLLIFLFIALQFIAYSWINFAVYAALLIYYGLLNLDRRGQGRDFSPYLLISLMGLLALVLIVPTILGNHLDKDQSDYRILKISEKKVNSYSKLTLDNSARSSMWRSSLPWIKDYFVLGSGLDTTKYMFPKYREPRYGILEGGHNYTPDRLHNEYLNTLATKGLFGFVAFYIAFLGTWAYQVLRVIYERRERPEALWVSGAIAGVGVYFFQVLFNFGVVATLFMCFVLMGFAYSFVRSEPESSS